jgi:redox-sensitive bicupin YhaK (pirin superfamily)
MTRLDAPGAEDVQRASDRVGPRAFRLDAREVPLGGVRAMEVRRILPHRDLPMVGAWCFLDRFGPQEALMRVEPHPHIGLQTVTWPFVGEVHHRDSVESDVVVERGALNLMTSGAGISHSEYSVGDDPIPLDALQLWIALPDSRRHGEPLFERHTNLPTIDLAHADGTPSGTATVVIGELAGVTSPASAFTPLVGAEVAIAPGAMARIPLRRDWEYALVGVFGDTLVDTRSDASSRTDASNGTDAPSGTDPAASDSSLAPQQLLYLGSDRDHVDVTTRGGSAHDTATLFLIGGEPFEDDIVMWWNFVGRAHDEIVEARDAWEAGAARFGHVVGHGEERVPAPPLPAVRLTPRRRRG